MIETTTRATVPQDVVDKDHGLVQKKTTANNMAAAADRELDQFRWENTLCPDGPKFDFSVYAKAVGVKSASAIKVSAEAWAAHNIPCSDLSHAKSAEAVEAAEQASKQQPSTKDHAKSRTVAKHGADMAAALEAIAKAFGVSPGNAGGHYKEPAARAISMADDAAAAEGRERNATDLAVAAAQIKGEYDADKTLRRKIHNGIKRRNEILGNEDDIVTKAQVASFLQEQQEKLDVAIRAGVNATLADLVESAIDKMIAHAQSVNTDWLTNQKRRDAVVDTLFAGNKAVSSLRWFWDQMNQMEESVKIDSGLTDDDLHAFRSVVVMAQCWITAIDKRLGGDTTASYKSELDAYNAAHADLPDFEAVLSDTEIFAFLEREAGKH